MSSTRVRGPAAMLAAIALLAGLCPACIGPEFAKPTDDHKCCPKNSSHHSAPANPEKEECPRARLAVDLWKDSPYKIVFESAGAVGESPVVAVQPFRAPSPTEHDASPPGAELHILLSTLRI